MSYTRNSRRSLYSFVDPSCPLPDHQQSFIAERMGIEETIDGQWIALVTPYGDELLRAGVCHTSCPDVIVGIGFSNRRARHLLGCYGSTRQIHCVGINGKHHHGDEAKKLMEELKQEAIQDAISDARKNLAKLKQID